MGGECEEIGEGEYQGPLVLSGEAHKECRRNQMGS